MSARLRGRGGLSLLLLPALVLGASACGSAGLEDLMVRNTPNAFEFSAQLDDASGAREDTWSVSGDRVWVDWSGTALESGSVSLELTSPDALSAYRESARVGAAPASAASLVSSPGEWTVQLSYSGAVGPLHFTLTGVQ